MAAQRVDLGAQRRGRAHDRVGGEARGRRARVAPRASAPNRPASAQAVENCVPLISASPSLGPSVTGRGRRRERLGGGQGLARDLDLALADHRGGHVGERREVARGADRALHGDDGQRRPARASPSSSATISQRTPEAPRPSDSSFSAIISRTTSRGAGAPTPAQCDRIRLRCSARGVAGRDPDARELAEAGVDAVDRRASPAAASATRAAAASTGGARGAVEDDGAVAAPDRLERREPDRAGREGYHVRTMRRLRPRAGRARPCGAPGARVRIARRRARDAIVAPAPRGRKPGGRAKGLRNPGERLPRGRPMPEERRAVFALFRYDSFFSVWYWVLTVVVWTLVCQRTLGVPHDMVLRGGARCRRSRRGSTCWRGSPPSGIAGFGDALGAPLAAVGGVRARGARRRWGSGTASRRRRPRSCCSLPLAVVGGRRGARSRARCARARLAGAPLRARPVAAAAHATRSIAIARDPRGGDGRARASAARARRSEARCDGVARRALVTARAAALGRGA